MLYFSRVNEGCFGTAKDGVSCDQMALGGKSMVSVDYVEQDFSIKEKIEAL